MEALAILFTQFVQVQTLAWLYNLLRGVHLCKSCWYRSARELYELVGVMSECKLSTTLPTTTVKELTHLQTALE